MIRNSTANIWKAIRDLQHEQREQNDRLAVLEVSEEKRMGTRDWIFTRLIPAITSIVVAYAALATLLHW